MYNVTYLDNNAITVKNINEVTGIFWGVERQKREDLHQKRVKKIIFISLEIKKSKILSSQLLQKRLGM